MDTNLFTSFLRLSQYTGTCIANPLNMFLIYLILTKSAKKVGNYKYLMIYVSVFEIIFSITAWVTEPFLHSFTTRVLVIMKCRNTIFSRGVCFFLDCAMCTVYGISMTVFSIHFLYRYAFLYPKSRKYFEGWNLAFWMCIPLLYGVIWHVTYYFLYGMTEEFTEFIRGPLLTNLDINVDDIVYVGPYYFPEDKNGIHDMDWSAFWGMNIVWALIGSSATTGFVCGYLCYQKITNDLAHASNSPQMKSIQRQLFNALVMQSVIPFILMYLPSTVVLFCTFLQINIGNGSAFISYSVALYPAIDPLPSIMIVKNYRKATGDILKRIRYFVTCQKPPTPPASSIQMSSLTALRN